MLYHLTIDMQKLRVLEAKLAARQSVINFLKNRCDDGHVHIKRNEDDDTDQLNATITRDNAYKDDVINLMHDLRHMFGVYRVGMYI